MLSHWSEGGSNSAVLGLIFGGFAEVFGISEAQSQKIKDYVKDPEIMALNKEIGRLSTETDGGAFAKDASEETHQKYLELRLELQNLYQKKQNDVVNETLTPDQLRKIKEYQIANMSTDALVSPDMFEVLNLSGAQKKQLEEIKEKLKPEVEKQIDKIVEHQTFYQEKMFDEIGDKLNDVTDPAERIKIITEAQKKVADKYPGYIPETSEYLASGKILSEKLKVEMFDVLNDEQWERMLDLIDNPPDHVKKYFERFNKIMSVNNTQTESGWQPGPNSWRPGDAIPEAYRIERNERSRFKRETSREN